MLASSEALKSLHVIVPISDDEKLWRDLLNDLVHLPQGALISLVGQQDVNEKELEKIRERSLFTLQHEKAPGSLAEQLNRAAFRSKHSFLWFLHADSKIPKSTLSNLNAALEAKPDAIHYCQLHFLDDGPSLMFLNSLAVQLRSRLLNLSFGHQGLALSARQFEHVGGFNEDLDHQIVEDFIWRAKAKGISLNPVDSPIYTSARYYKNHGWGRASAERFFKETKSTVRDGSRFLLHRVFQRRV